MAVGDPWTDEVKLLHESNKVQDIGAVDKETV